MHTMNVLLLPLATLPIVARRAADIVLVKVHVQGQPVRTLQRPAAEAVSRSLGRVRRALAPQGSKNAERCMLFDAGGLELHPATNALHAWSTAAHLQVGGMSLDVVWEPAEVASLILPAVVPFVGVPLTPVIKTLGCAAEECRWVWEGLPTDTASGSRDGEWQPLGFGRTYTPSDADLGSRLRVRR